jgi:hypothetical protein
MSSLPPFPLLSSSPPPPPLLPCSPLLPLPLPQRRVRTSSISLTAIIFPFEKGGKGRWTA